MGGIKWERNKWGKEEGKRRIWAQLYNVGATEQSEGGGWMI